MLIFDTPIPTEEKKWITHVFKSFEKDGFYSNLQYLYNNSQHSTTIKNVNICTPEFLEYLALYAKSKKHNIHIIGSVHTNHHVSNVLFDLTSHPLFVKDTYIRILVDGSTKYDHILMLPPNISDISKINTYYYKNDDDTCFKPPASSFIAPTFYPE